MSATAIDWTGDASLPEVRVLFQNAFASVQAEIETALQHRDKDKADEILRNAYLAAVPAMVEATLRHMAPSIAEQYRAKICAKSHVNLIPAPVKAEAPKPKREITRVTKHSPDGRILEFERVQVEA